MYPSPALGAGGGAATTLPSAAAGSRHYVWPDYGRTFVHTNHGADPGSAIDVCCPAAAGHSSILDALAWLVGPTVADNYFNTMTL
jgi:hypothetical protein